MRLLFCCEFYFPSVGGVQEVMRQIAERMVRRGHDVTVATTRLANRDFTQYNGVKIVEFGVTGNLVWGIEGEVERYREFVTSFQGDAILIKAAQQWTFDGLWSVLDQISMRKVLIPCGFSGLYEPAYKAYFVDLPGILKKFDHLIFYSERYRDIDFARLHQINNFSVVPNGACEIEFGVPKDPAFRRAKGIPENSVVLMTVGTFTGVKGHRELLEAFSRLTTSLAHVTLIMNGNQPSSPLVRVERPQQQQVVAAPDQGRQVIAQAGTSTALGRARLVWRDEGARGILRRIGIRVKTSYLGWQISRVFRIVQLINEEGFVEVRERAARRLASRLRNRPKLLRFMPAALRLRADPMGYWMAEALRPSPRKLLVLADFPRNELIQAYLTADLFVFASNIEYSPLVLFEALAAGTPFLSVPVGNAEEVARWTHGGIICPADRDERGYTRVDPKVLAEEIATAIENPERLVELGSAGFAAWQDRYTWEAITSRYEAILEGKQDPLA